VSSLLPQHKEALDVHGQSAHLEFVTFRDEMQAREQELDRVNPNCVCFA